MNQTSIIAAALLAAFIVFITIRSELVQYFQVIGLAAGTPCSGPAQTSPQVPALTNVQSTITFP